MKPAQVKIVAVGVAVAAGILLLAMESGKSATVYYQTLPEFKKAPPTDKSVRITGYVADGTIDRKPGEPITFVMRDKEKTALLKVNYGGIVPDTFKDRAEVVVEGKMGSDQVFHATTLLAKCPSKYESGEEEQGTHPEDIALAGS